MQSSYMGNTSTLGRQLDSFGPGGMGGGNPSGILKKSSVPVHINYSNAATNVPDPKIFKKFPKTHSTAFGKVSLFK